MSQLFATMSQAEMAAMMALEITAVSATPLIRLFKGNLAINPLTTLAALVAAEPVGSWYTPAVGVPGAPYLLPDGSIAMTYGSVEFNYSGTDPSEVITGYFVVAGTVPRLVCARLLDVAVTMGHVLDAVIVEPSFKFAPSLAA